MFQMNICRVNICGSLTFQLELEKLGPFQTSNFCAKSNTKGQKVLNLH